MASRIVALARNRSKSAITLKRLAAYRAEVQSRLCDICQKESATRTIDGVNVCRQEVSMERWDAHHEKRGFCNCCGKDVPLLTEPETGDSICKICRSYDVRVQR